MSKTVFNLDKTLKEIDENEYLRKTGFKELISSIISIIFNKIPIKNKSFNPFFDQKITLSYEMNDFTKEINEIETTSRFKGEAYKKALFLVALRRLKNTNYKFSYTKDNFKLDLDIDFQKHIGKIYPVEVKISYKNIPENPEIQEEIIEELVSSSFNNIKIPKDISEEKTSKKGTHIQSGHYNDMKLKHQYEEAEKDNKLTEFKDENIARMIREEKIVLGIRLSVSEDRVLNSILKLLHDKSDRTLGSNNFFKGNEPPEKVVYGGKLVDFPVLSFSPSELYKEYISNEEYSGAEANHVRNTLENLAQKNFLFIYKRHRLDEKGNEVIDRIEEYKPLLQIIKYYEGITQEEDLKLDKKDIQVEEKGNIIVCLNHIFIDQIDTKFIEYPNDINKRTVIAAGGVRQVTESNIRIRDYFLRELSNKHKTSEINEDKLPYILGLDNYIKSGRKKLINKRIQEAIDFSLNLNIITNYEKVEGVNGQIKFKFYLNQSF